MNGRLIEKLSAVICALCLTAGVMGGFAVARGEEERSAAEEVPATAEPAETFVVIGAAEEETARPVPLPEDGADHASLYVNGIDRGVCTVIDGIPYAGPEEFCAAIGIDAAGGSSGGRYMLSGDGFSLSAVPGDFYILFNGRYLYAEPGLTVDGGKYLLPVELLAGCFNVTALWDPSGGMVAVKADAAAPLESGESFYVETDIYWLSRLIYAAAGGTSLRAQTAVGAVVLNRVCDEAFAGQDSVYDVIFAKNQFDVVINGMIYMEPNEEAVTAAKLALDGADTSCGATSFSADEPGGGAECTARIDGLIFWR